VQLLCGVIGLQLGDIACRIMGILDVQAVGCVVLNLGMAVILVQRACEGSAVTVLPLGEFTERGVLDIGDDNLARLRDFGAADFLDAACAVVNVVNEGAVGVLDGV